MLVTFLGTGVAIPEAGRGPTSTLLRVGDFSVMVDAGSGSLQKLQAAGVDLLELDALLLTHDHIDHLVDVIPMLFAFHIPFYRRTRPLAIYATQETIDRIHAVQQVFGSWLQPNDGAIEWHAVSRNERFELGPLRVTTGAVVHTEASVGFRLEARASGVTIAIPGDTGYTESLRPLLDGVDLAVLECSVPDEFAMETHLCPSEIARLGAETEPVAIALVHRYPLVKELDVAQQIGETYRGRLLIPDDLTTWQLRDDGLTQIKEPTRAPG